MLMLTRRKGESVDLINRDTREVLATVTVLEFIPDGKVRMGFQAPPEIAIVRDNAKDRGHGAAYDGQTQDSVGNR